MSLLQSGSVTPSTSPTNTADQAEWEFVRPSESPAWSVESLGAVPSAEEAREATRYLVESLTGSVTFFSCHMEDPSERLELVSTVPES